MTGNNTLMNQLVSQGNARQGQILGLAAILAAILKHNPNLKFDQVEIGRIIMETKGEPGIIEEIRRQARELMHTVLANSGR